MSDKSKRPLVLVVEDIPKNMEVVCNILRKEGYRLAMAGNGLQALEMVVNVLPDLILLDIMMPEMDGFEVCKRLKENPLTCEIPIIFLTAIVETVDIVKGFELGAVDYVTKPFKGAELTSRVKTHLELKFARQSLQELNYTKDKFFSIIAHDLKDPLQYLLLSADMLYNQYEDLGEEKRKDYIRRFYNNSQQISQLLDNLLEWSRSQRGIMTFNPIKINLSAVVAECFRLAGESASKKNITLTSTIPPDTYIFADKNMFKTILRNLIVNGIKFTSSEGFVKIDAIPSLSGRKVEISVIDNGVGMNQEQLDGLFKIEKMRTTPGTDKEKGTGLGLILCKEFVEKNNGTIQVVSQINQGSTFKITLPTPAS